MSSSSSQAPPGDRNSNTKEKAKRTCHYVKWQTHTRRILLLSLAVTLPMITFTIATVWIVFSNQLDPNACPNPDLCRTVQLRNLTGNNNIYVDFPTAQLVFVSSMSATISFALVGLLMTIYGYCVADKLLKRSAEETAASSLPNPFQTSLLLRVLNAEVMALWELTSSKIRMVFFKRESSREGKRREFSASITTSALIILLVCLSSSLLIQIADVYLHIATKAVTMEQIYTVNPDAQNYSVNLAPWCLGDVGQGTYFSQYFWGCGLLLTNYSDGTLASPRNRGRFDDAQGKRTSTNALSHRLEDGSSLAIVLPRVPNTRFDWKATTYGVSAKCAAIPQSACVAIPRKLKLTDSNVRYKCYRDRGFIDEEVTLFSFLFSLHYVDNHALLKDSPLFYDGSANHSRVDHAGRRYASKATLEDTEKNFKNPWRSFHTIAIDSNSEKAFVSKKDDRYWKPWPLTTHLFLDCNTTVWDVEYTAHEGNVSNVSLRKSNGSMAGLVSVPTMAYSNFYEGDHLDAIRAAIAQAESLDQMIDLYALGFSKVLTMPLLANTIPKPAIVIQERIPKLMSSLPRSALGISLASNALFVLLGLTIGVVALCASSKDTHQVHERLGVAGLVAQLCDTANSKMAVESTADLFDTKKSGEEAADSLQKRVGVKKTDEGGSMFVVSGVSQ